MPKLCDEKLCTGCHACYNICPIGSIMMEEDKEGFLYPIVNSDLCIECRLCEKACPVLVDAITQDKQPQSYAAYSKEEINLKKSSSGGVFYHIAKSIIEDGGVVFGAAFDNAFNAVHKEIDQIENIAELQGSKYVQSEIGQVYKKAKYFLEKGKKVLFTGTPCQVQGLYGFLGMEYENLYTQDFICHGVPSPKVWQLYLEYREKKASSKTRRVFFRHKRYGWKKYSLLLEYSNDTEYVSPSCKDAYLRGFVSNLYLRPSCHQCSFKGVGRNSDITLSDFWGVENVIPELYDERGISLILINSPKGQDIFSKISSDLITVECDFDKAIEYNRAAVISAVAHKKRNEFLFSVSSDNFEEMIDLMLKVNLIDKLKIRFKKVLVKLRRLAK